LAVKPLTNVTIQLRTGYETGSKKRGTPQRETHRKRTADTHHRNELLQALYHGRQSGVLVFKVLYVLAIGEKRAGDVTTGRGKTVKKL